MIKSIHIDKVIEDFAGYNTVFKEVHPEVKRIHDAVEETVKDCDVVSRKSYTDPNPDGANEAFDAFTSEDKTTGHVPEFKDKFIAFCDEHANDIEGSTFKSVLDGIVQNLNNIIDGMQKGTLDITRFNETKSNIKWLDPEDMVSPEDADAFLKYLKTYELYLKGLVDRCQVYKYDPVNMSSGNYINDRIDLEVGANGKLFFRRFYNAKSDFKGLLGNGWSCKGDSRLLEEDDGDIKITYPDGREGLYKKIEQTDNAYYEIHGEIGILKKEKSGYRIDKEQGEYEEYDAAGYLIAEGDNTGEQIRITYKDTLPVRMECKDGTYIDLSYNEDKILTRITDSQNRSVSYGYEVREEVGKREYYLTDATYPGGSVRRYIYNESGLIKSVISPDGVVALTNEYDEKRRVIHQMFPDGGEMSYSYDDEKHVTTATELNGLKVEYLSDEKGRHIGTRYVGLTKDHTEQDLSDDKNIIEEKYTYNKRNQKISVTDKNGHTTRYSYDNKGHLTKIVGPEGLNESYTYDANGRLLSKKDSEGNIYKYTYDFEGNLYSVTDPEGNRTKYDYEDGKVIRIRDAENGEILVTYDENGNVSSITDKNGVKTLYLCDKMGRVNKTVDAEGNETGYTFDENGNVTAVTDPYGNTTSYIYNGADLLTEVINPDGTTRRWNYNEIGKISSYKDEEDRITEITYNTSWKKEKMALPNGGETLFTYDLFGNLIKVTDPEGRKTVYTHDNIGNILTIGVEDKEVLEDQNEAAQGKYVQKTYTYDKRGRINSESDAEGNTTTYRYDRNGNLTCKIDALGGKTSYEYDSLQRVTKITDAIGRETIYTYDSIGNVETVTDPAKVVKTNHYEMGRLIKVTQKAEGTEEITIKAYEYDACGRMSKQIEIDGFETCYSYDKAGRVNKVTGANGRDIEYVYDQMGRAVEVIDCGTKTFYTYTGTGKLRSVADALGNETRYTYNELNLLSKIERVGEGAEPHVTTFEHDLSGNLINEIDALSQKTSYTYDAAGDIKSLTDRDGNETVYTRDKNGNITGIKYSDGKEVLYKYNALNILKEVQEKSGLTKIESDILGRTIKVTDPNGETVGYEYGPRDERTAVIYPDGKRAEYEFDAFGKLISLKDVNGSEDTIRYNYNDNGLLTDKIFPNGTSTSYDYYPGGLLKSLISSDKNGVLDKYEYTYNEKGNRTQIKRERRDLLNVSGIYSYSYDELGRLSETRKDNALQSTYSYDAFGNRIEEITEGVKTTYSYDILDRLISKTEFKTSGNNTSTYAYDNRGNLTREYENDTLTRTYDYNRQGMLEKTVLDPTSELKKEISYTYNFVNQRISKKSGLEEIKYLTDITRDHSNLLKETENGKVKTYTYDEQVVSFNSDGINTYYQTDELGSTMYLTGTDGAAYSPYAYDPFGNRIDPKTGRKANKHGYTKDGNIIQPFAFTGYREEESGLYYAQARSYDPRAGRFTGEDIVRGQLVYPDSINHYLYCYNMPMVLADRNGKNPGIVFAPLLANPVVLGLVVAIVVVVLINLIIPHKPVSIPRIEIFPDSRKEDNNVIIETPPARENPTIIEGPTAHPKEGPSITDIPSGKVEEEGSHIIEGPTATPQTGPHIITSEGTNYESGVGYTYKNGTFEGAKYHGNRNNGLKNKGPQDGQAALDNSVPISPNTHRRVGVSNGEIVVLDETTPGVYHGHVRSWSELSNPMKSALRKGGMVDNKGRIIER